MKWVTTVLIFFVACSHSSAPTAGLQDNDIDIYIRALAQAGTNPTEACASFQKVSDSSTFALKDVAHIHALQFCTTEQIKPALTRTVPEWLKKEERRAHLPHLSSDAEKALWIIETPHFFASKDRVLTYQKALADKILSKDAKAKIEAALYSIAPRFNPQPDPQDIFKVTKDLRSVRDFEKARKILSEIAKNKKLPVESRMMALKEIYLTYKIQRHLKSEYLESARRWAQELKPRTADFKKHIALFAEAQYTLVRTLWTEIGPDEPLQILRTLEKQLQNIYSRHDLYWLMAKIHEEKKEHTEAAVYFEKALKEPGISSRDQEKILWSLSWLRLQQKDNLTAITHLTALKSVKDVSAFAKLKYLYWLAEAMSRAEQKNQAQDIFEQLTKDDQFGYYGLIAHARIQKTLPQIPTTHPDTAITLLSDDEKKVFTSLLKTRENDLAAAYLNSHLLAKKRPQESSPEENLEILHLLAMTHNYKLVFEVFNQIPFEKQKNILATHPEVLFPKPFSETVDKAASSSGVEPELIYSIMRQESSFDPMARSPMDALGLLQLLPEVAQKMAPTIKSPYRQYDDLHNEAINIPLGAELLKRQQTRFDNHFILYVASYNASDSAVKQWRGRFNGDPIEFIESIPYEETKAYVKLVMRNYIIYKKLRFGEDFKVFPQHILEL